MVLLSICTDIRLCKKKAFGRGVAAAEPFRDPDEGRPSERILFPSSPVHEKVGCNVFRIQSVNLAILIALSQYRIICGHTERIPAEGLQLQSLPRSGNRCGFNNLIPEGKERICSCRTLPQMPSMEHRRRQRDCSCNPYGR